MASKPIWFVGLRVDTICNMKGYTSKLRPVKNLVLELLGAQLLNKCHHLHHENYYNSAQLSEMCWKEKNIHLWYTVSRHSSYEGKNKINEERRVNLLL